MEARGFENWSPASVFGATLNVDAAVKHSEGDNNREAERYEPSIPETVKQSSSLTTTRYDKATKLTTERWAQETPEHDDTIRFDLADEAARLLQRRLRVWLLYRRERESLAQVELLRDELERAAAQAIAEWLVRCRQRFHIGTYLAEYARQRLLRLRSTRQIARWLVRRWKRSHRRARASLNLVCWWRRRQLMHRCIQRRAENHRQATALNLAACVLARSVRRFVHNRRARFHAANQLRAFALCTLARRRAQHELARLRRHRQGFSVIVEVLARWRTRIAVLNWKSHTIAQRQADEQRQHQAARVLQRLVRVMLTAFRLLRQREAVTRVQNTLRGHQARWQYHRLRDSRRQTAATHIQRIARGRLARKLFVRLVQQLRERFKCANCGLIEPGGLYCKFCGRRRVTFEVLGARAAASSCTTEAKLRKRRTRRDSGREETGAPPPAPPMFPASAKRPTHRRGVEGVGIAAPVLTMLLPDVNLPSPSKVLPSVVALPKFVKSELEMLSPVGQPRKPMEARASSGRPSAVHRSLTISEPLVPMAGLTSVDKTKQRAEALLRQDYAMKALGNSGTMGLHLQRLHKGGKAASR